MNALNFMDKQIMDLSRSKSDLSINANNKDFMDLMNPQSEHDQHNNNSTTTAAIDDNISKNDEILPNYDFHPIRRLSSTTFHSLSSSSDHLASSAPAVVNAPISASRDWNSSPVRSYNSLDRVEHDKIILEKAQKVNDSDILSEIDRTMKKHMDGLMHAIDSLSARLSQMENRTRHLEHSLDDLKLSIGNSHGSADGKLRHLENILLEVQSGVQTLKDKQELMEGHMELAKLQISKVEQSSELPNASHQDHVHQAAAASAPPQQSSLQQFAHAVSLPAPPMPPPNVLPPSQQNIHPPPPMTSQFPAATDTPGPQRDAYFRPPSQSHEASSQQYQTFPPGQYQQPPPAPQTQPQQYQPAPTPPYSQPLQPPQQHHPPVVAANTSPFQPSLGHHLDERPYVPSQTYPPNLHHPVSQPTSAPPPTQPYHGSPSSMYEPPPAARSSFGFPSAYVPPSGASEQYPYGGPLPHYGSGSSMKPQPHSPRAGTGSYPQLPTARILPPAIPTASGISGGSSSGGSGNKVPIDDVVDKVTSMGFSREQVKGTVRKLTENGQSVDLNVVLDKLMNDADVQPPRGWFGR